LKNENILAGNTPGKKAPPQEEDTIVLLTEKPIFKGEQDEDKVKIDDDRFVDVNIEKAPLDSGNKKDSSTATYTKQESSGNAGDGGSAIVKNAIVYSVQFASSDAPMNLKQIKFAAVVEPDFYKVNAILKYTSGKFKTFKEATAHKNELKTKGLEDCFVVAFQNGTRISISEAIKVSGN
jgi:N-acetylmuramoyl-L-alanine amidase